MCKTDKKTRNYIIFLPRDKMSHKSCELIVDFRGQKPNQIQQNFILELKRLAFEKTTKNKSE